MPTGTLKSLVKTPIPMPTLEEHTLRLLANSHDHARSLCGHGPHWGLWCLHVMSITVLQQSKSILIHKYANLHANIGFSKTVHGTRRLLGKRVSGQGHPSLVEGD